MFGKTQMKYSALIIILIAGWLSLLEAGEKAAGKWLVDDFTFYKVPIMKKPEKGAVYIDPVTSMKIIRITDPVIDKYGGKKGGYASGGYPKHSIENFDRSLIALYLSGKGMSLYDAKTFKFIKVLAGSGNSRPTTAEIRWDSRDPDIIYYAGGWDAKATKLHMQNVKTGKITVLHDFAEDFPWASKVSMREEGDSSADSRYWAFMAKGKGKKAVVTYDKDSGGKNKGKVIGKLDNAGADWIGMSPSGKYVIFGEVGVHTDIELKKQYKRKFMGHSDLAIDDEGREVMFNGFRVTDLETCKDTHYPIYNKPFRPWHIDRKINGKKAAWFGAHISGNNYGTPGWALVSTYSSKTPDQLIYYPEQCLLMVEVTQRKNPPPRVWRVAYHQSQQKKYADAPFAKTNLSGTRIYYGSNLNKSQGEYNVYCVQLPDGWYEKLMGKQKAKELREKTAKLTGLSVKELSGVSQKKESARR